VKSDPGLQAWSLLILGIKVFWEYAPTPDAKQMLDMAFDMIFDKIEEEQTGANGAEDQREPKQLRLF
jgi:hypothetical protein